MALRSRDFLTPLELDQFLPAVQLTAQRPAGVPPTVPLHQQVCFLHTRRNACTTPCHLHPPCSRCNSMQHASDFHAGGQSAGPAGHLGAGRHVGRPARRGLGRRW